MLREPARLYYGPVIIFNCLAYWSSTDSNDQTQASQQGYTTASTATNTVCVSLYYTSLQDCINNEDLGPLLDAKYYVF